TADDADGADGSGSYPRPPRPPRLKLMSLQNRLSDEIKAAMLAKDADKLSTLRLLKSALGYAQVERKTDTLPDADFVALVQKEVKKRRDAIEQYEKGGRS